MKRNSHHQSYPHGSDAPSLQQDGNPLSDEYTASVAARQVYRMNQLATSTTLPLLDSTLLLLREMKIRFTHGW